MGVPGGDLDPCRLQAFATRPLREPADGQMGVGGCSVGVCLPQVGAEDLVLDVVRGDPALDQPAADGL